jgi:hypothetical protein
MQFIDSYVVASSRMLNESAQYCAWSIRRCIMQIHRHQPLIARGSQLTVSSVHRVALTDVSACWRLAQEVPQLIPTNPSACFWGTLQPELRYYDCCELASIEALTPDRGSCTRRNLLATRPAHPCKVSVTCTHLPAMIAVQLLGEIEELKLDAGLTNVIVYWMQKAF